MKVLKLSICLRSQLAKIRRKVELKNFWADFGDPPPPPSAVAGFRALSGKRLPYLGLVVILIEKAYRDGWRPK